MSSKRETHRADLRPLLLAALASPGLLPPAEFDMARFHLSAQQSKHLLDPDISALEDYLIDHSALPGRRANLELVWAFADEIGALCADPAVSLNQSYIAAEWLLWRLLNRHPSALFGDDPDSPLQMPQLCGVVAYGEWAVRFRHIESGVALLLEHGGSPLWRVREGVAMGLQRMLAHNWRSTVRRLRRASQDAGPLQWRALVAGVAEPDLLQPDTASGTTHTLDALDLHYRALAYLRRLRPETRRTDPVRTLRKALGYTVSVVVTAAPEAGFAQMRAWAAWDDPDVTWVIRENLKKKRLAPWPDEVNALHEVVAQ
ncbi:MAG: hypothetical protein GYB65_01775 [Chloroflexi bacterium]|nr:hypothetical protein [Chloroflexota bacterium]